MTNASLAFAASGTVVQFVPGYFLNDLRANIVKYSQARADLKCDNETLLNFIKKHDPKRISDKPVQSGLVYATAKNLMEAGHSSAAFIAFCMKHQDWLAPAARLLRLSSTFADSKSQKTAMEHIGREMVQGLGRASLLFDLHGINLQNLREGEEDPMALALIKRKRITMQTFYDSIEFQFLVQYGSPLDRLNPSEFLKFLFRNPFISPSFIKNQISPRSA